MGNESKMEAKGSLLGRRVGHLVAVLYAALYLFSECGEPHDSVQFSVLPVGRAGACVCRV